jgi:hypothetical protein
MINIEMGNSGVTFNCIVCDEGNQYCVMIKDTCLSTAPAGFGSTVMEAAEDFKDSVRNHQRKKQGE